MVLRSRRVNRAHSLERMAMTERLENKKIQGAILRSLSWLDCYGATSNGSFIAGIKCLS